MGEVSAQVPPFASPAEVGIGTFWAFPRGLAVPSVLGVIRNLLSAHPRGALPRYIAAVIGAAFVYGVEQLLKDDFARCVVADFAWTGAAVGAIFGTARAVHASREKDRMVWLLFCAGSVSWLVGQLLRDAAEVGGLPIPSPLIAELGFMTAAPIWTIAFVLLLRRHGQRLTLYALVLDVGAVVLTLAAAVTLFLATTLATDVSRDPQGSAVAVLYPLLYVAATAAALSAVWGIPQQEPRGAVTSLFIGLGLNALAFVLYLPANVEGTFKAGTPIDVLWIVGVGAVGIAGAQWVEDREEQPALRGGYPHLADGAAGCRRRGVLVPSCLHRHTQGSGAFRRPDRCRRGLNRTGPGDESRPGVVHELAARGTRASPGRGACRALRRRARDRWGALAR